MLDERLIQLLARNLSGECSPAEKEELDDLLIRNPEAVFYVELFARLWEEEKMRKLTARQTAERDMAYLEHVNHFHPDFKRSRSEEDAASDDRHSGMEEEYGDGLLNRRWLKFAAWLLLPVLAAGLLFIKGSPKPKAQTAPQDNAAFFARLGTRRAMTLPDGTKVWLNAGSLLSYDSNMLRKDTREVSLSGEAFFDVAKDKDRCFIIHTDKIAIRVLGTSFNVRAYPRDKITETTLMGGSIELTVNNKPYQKIILKPKEKFALIDDPQDDAPPARHSADHSATASAPPREKLIVQEVMPIHLDDKEYVKEISWVDDEFVFQNETLEELAPKMERWFSVSMEIGNSEIRKFHFTGIFHKETIDQALTAMQLIKPFKFKITGNHVFIN